jgi:hypothetical protein
MNFSDLVDPNWWAGAPQTPINAARAGVEEATGAYRSPNGSLDPNNITPEYLKQYGISPSAGADIKEIVGLGKMRADAMKGTFDPPKQSPLQFLGAALSAASVPVAYAQGNNSYGQAMLGKTGADIYNQRTRDYQDAAVKDQRDIVADTFSSVDKTTQAIQTTRRDRQQKALSGAEVLIRQGKVKDAVTLLRTNGLIDHAKELEARVSGAQPQGQPQQPGAQPAPMPGAPATQPPIQGMPGISVAPPTGPAGTPAPTGQGGPSAGVSPPAGPTPPATNAPPQGGVPPQGAPQPSQSQIGGGSVVDNLSDAPLYQPSPQAREKLDQAQYAHAMGRPDLAKILEDEAKALDTGREAYAKKGAEKSAEERIQLEVDRPQAQRSLMTMDSSIDNMQKTLSELLTQDEAKGGVKLSEGAARNVGGWYDTYFPNAPGGKAADASAKIEKLRSNIGMQVLSAMREASKSGGAVGSVTEKEWPILQNQLGSLDATQSDEDFAKSLVEINQSLDRIKAATYSAFDETYGTNLMDRLSASRQSGPERTSAGAGGGGTPPAATPNAAQVPKGETRLFADGVLRQKVDGGWAPVQAEASQQRSGKFGPGFSPRAGRI